MSFISFFYYKIASKIFLEKEMFVNITLIPGIMVSLAIKMRRIKHKIGHKTCKK